MIVEERPRDRAMESTDTGRDERHRQTEMMRERVRDSPRKGQRKREIVVEMGRK